MATSIPSGGAETHLFEAAANVYKMVLITSYLSGLEILHRQKHYLNRHPQLTSSSCIIIVSRILLFRNIVWRTVSSEGLPIP